MIGGLIFGAVLFWRSYFGGLILAVLFMIWGGLILGCIIFGCLTFWRSYFGGLIFGGLIPGGLILIVAVSMRALSHACRH